MFSHHKLKVYDHALAFAATASTLCANCPKVHAVVDQLLRASESTVVNIAEGARLRSIPAKQRTLDYAIGSTLECAACLDVAGIKQLLPPTDCEREKHHLCEITKMLIGLSKSWNPSALQEEPSAYASDSLKGSADRLFHHENLDVYQTALNFIRWFHSLPEGKALRDRLHRDIDKASTSLVLNIAEGNGRYFEADHRKFIEIAHASTVKAAVYLDLCKRRQSLAEAEGVSGQKLLGRISAMLDRMVGN
jgi:four helix bundle protein